MQAVFCFEKVQDRHLDGRVSSKDHPKTTPKLASSSYAGLCSLGIGVNELTNALKPLSGKVTTELLSAED